MKKYIVAILLLNLSYINAQDLKYYLPDSINYNPSIPKPKDIIYHEVGEWHVTHDRLVNYMKAIAVAAPDRVKFETIGFTYENRPQVLLIITSKKNHDRLEEIRKEHLQLSTQTTPKNIENMPAIVWIGHSIHGNESSGANASLLSAYYLAAAEGKQIEALLDNVVILFDPSFNPDGLQRFSTWANQHKSKNLVTDPNSREFNEVWPGGRFNHYWFDLNRDWLPAVHVESKNRLKWFQMWKPNILTDHHEMGSNSSFFFQPGVPTRVNPLTPEKNQELTTKIGKFHAQFMDRIGSLYFTKEGYDDFYYGKCSTYPDVQGCIGILFEQASSRGHAQETSNGILTFPFTIKNQFTATLSTLEAAKNLRKELLAYQKEFYQQSSARAANHSIKAYVFGDKKDKNKTKLFAEMLMRHNIQINHVSDDWGDKDFDKESSYTISLNQPQHSLIRGIFDKTLEYKDSLFYDITAWTMPLAFGINYKEIAENRIGKKVDVLREVKGEVVSKKSSYGYLIEWDDFYAPAALNEMLNDDIIVKVATNTFEISTNNSNKKFNYGTLLIPVQLQKINQEKLADKLQLIAEKYKIRIQAVESGNAITGSDLGSNKFITITKPSIAMLVGTGVNATDAGEVWHVLDQRMNMNVSQLEIGMFNRINLSKYNTLIMVGGSYGDLNKEKLKAWVQAGGTLILTEEAVSWSAQNGISDIKLKKIKSAVDSTKRDAYINRDQVEGAQQLNGAIFGAEADLTHPLAYGYNNKTVSMFKSNKVFMEKSKNPYATPFYYNTNPLQSGWLSKENTEAIKNTASVIVNTLGSGRVINIADNPNFRGFWLGGNKLFMNAIFFGRIIDAASGRMEE